jgi:hypothetical protein
MRIRSTQGQKSAYSDCNRAKISGQKVLAPFAVTARRILSGPYLALQDVFDAGNRQA